MPWFEERSLFVGDTQIRWYEPGVCKCRIYVDSKSDGCLPLKAGGYGIVHGNSLIWQHFLSLDALSTRVVIIETLRPSEVSVRV